MAANITFIHIFQLFGLIFSLLLLLVTLNLTLSLRNISSTLYGHPEHGLTSNQTSLHLNINRNKPQNRSILLAVGVLNRLSLKSRREVIRMTWFKLCHEETNRHLVRCNFFTDDYGDLNQTERLKVEDEDEKYDDMQFMPIKGGHQFAKRLIWMLQWYTENFDFQYFLRVDDDYFVCLDRLLYEVKLRTSQGLYWGYTHCTDNVIRVDEGWMVLSRDIVDESLNKLNSSLLCHPFGDQAVALWIRDSQLKINWFPDNRRIVHQATAYNEKKYMVPGFCNEYLAMHGSYQLQMLKYWILSKEDNRDNKVYHVPPIPEFSSFCKKNRTFNVNAFWGHVRFMPKLCKTNPEWGVTNQKFVGREEYGQDMIY